mmetsp:Transcript_38547/g.60110  ORF Transcript_38547/g.60110 Transcript_38547/m.60110 type:complete len:448 (+) Transcript_38547:2-1345(+)
MDDKLPRKSLGGKRQDLSMRLGSEQLEQSEVKNSMFQLLFQLVGSPRGVVLSTCMKRLPAIIGVDLVRIVLRDDEAGKDFLQFDDDQGLEQNERLDISSGIAGLAYAKKTYINVKDAANFPNFNLKTDLGDSGVKNPGKWQKPGLLAFPIPKTAELQFGVLVAAKAAGEFDENEIEMVAWLCVLLGQVLAQSEGVATLESHVTLMETAAQEAIGLARLGWEVQDPHFWLRSFKSQIAQVILVHRRVPGGPFLLYCTCCDISREAVSMTCFPLKGLCQKLVLESADNPILVDEAEREPGLDREVDLGGSDFEGKTAVMLVPVKSGGRDDRVIAILMVSSTATPYTLAHVKMFQAMSYQVKGGLVKVLKGWEEDDSGSYNQSYLDSDLLNPQIKEVSAEISEESVVVEEPSELVQVKEVSQESVVVEESEDMLYEYSKSGIEKMLHLSR